MKRRTKIYLEAARLVAEGEKIYCCYAISEQDVQDVYAARHRFFELFKHDGSQPGGYWNMSRHWRRQQLRVLSLCFMAAMAEVGDA